MKTILTALALAALGALPAGATPTSREVIAPDELMVITPGLEYLGYSRISTVEFCQETNDVNDWMNLITDAELELMEGCLIEMQ